MWRRASRSRPIRRGTPSSSAGWSRSVACSTGTDATFPLRATRPALRPDLEDDLDAPPRRAYNAGRPGGCREAPAATLEAVMLKRLLIVPVTLAALLTQPVPSTAQIPDPANSECPPQGWIYVVGHDGTVGDARGEFCIIVRDFNNVP